MSIDEMHDEFYAMVAENFSNYQYARLVDAYRNHASDRIAHTPGGPAFLAVWVRAMPTEDEIHMENVASSYGIESLTEPFTDPYLGS